MTRGAATASKAETRVALRGPAPCARAGWQLSRSARPARPGGGRRTWARNSQTCHTGDGRDGSTQLSPHGAPAQVKSSGCRHASARASASMHVERLRAGPHRCSKRGGAASLPTLAVRGDLRVGGRGRVGDLRHVRHGGQCSDPLGPLAPSSAASQSLVQTSDRLIPVSGSGLPVGAAARHPMPRPRPSSSLRRMGLDPEDRQAGQRLGSGPGGAAAPRAPGCRSGVRNAR